MRTRKLFWTRATATTVLRRGGWIHQHRSLAGPCCLASEDGAKLRPARIRDALLGQVAVAHQGGDPQVFEGETVVLAQEPQAVWWWRLASGVSARWEWRGCATASPPALQR